MQRGDARGRELGYPTANLTLGDYQRPRYGIYAVRVTLDDGSEHPGVASLGVRPTFEPPQELLEAYLFGFDGDLYGRRIEVALHAYIREEQKFDSVDELVAADARGRGGGAAVAGAAVIPPDGDRSSREPDASGKLHMNGMPESATVRRGAPLPLYSLVTSSFSSCLRAWEILDCHSPGARNDGLQS